MKLKISRERDAIAIAAALKEIYPSYDYWPKRYPKCRTGSIAVYCRATGALLLTRRAEV